jgi:hypothetical protein
MGTMKEGDEEEMKRQGMGMVWTNDGPEDKDWRLVPRKRMDSGDRIME